jgi:hypothetical protein
MIFENSRKGQEKMMPSRHVSFCSIFFVVGLLVGMPIAAEKAADSSGNGIIEAKLVLAGEGGGAEGATIHAYHIDTQTTLTSEPANRKGNVVLKDVPYGYLDLAVELDGNFYVASQVVVVPPSGKVVIHMKLEPYPPGTESTARSFEGHDEPAQGVARLERKAVGREFWRSPKGIAIITGASGVALLAIASGSDSPTVSPF